MDHPLAPPADALRPWRATALVASAVAGAELVALVVVGVAFFGNTLTHHGHAKAAPVVRAPAAAVGRRVAKHVPAAIPKLTRHETSVLVLNGNGVAGAAAGAASRVRGLGYMVGGVGNAANANTGPSIVMYRPGFRAEGLRLGRDLHARVGPLDGLRPGDLMGAHVAYVVGS